MRFLTRIFVLLATTLATIPALAALFTYRDEKGKLHAVSSPDEIPEKYRRGAKTVSDKKNEPEGANIKLDRSNNSLFIEVSFGEAGKHLMVLDTGASISMISEKLAADLGLKSTQSVIIHTASGMIEVPLVTVPEVSVAHFKVRDLSIAVNNLPGESKAQGLLGIDFLNHFKMELDTAAGSLYLRQKNK